MTPAFCSEALSSPRAWGCFLPLFLADGREAVFPTCVGVFLTGSKAPKSSAGLPHVRGGVSYVWGIAGEGSLSSPRAWGCFPYLDFIRNQPCVFPTCVGVFLRWHKRTMMESRLPHVRGGVSMRRATPVLHTVSSPRAWGCFHTAFKIYQRIVVFPTCVGVFPYSVQDLPAHCRLPHVRGGVSNTGQRHRTGIASSPRAWGCFYHCARE